MEDEFTLQVPTLRYVPSGARASVAQASEELCRAVLRAETPLDEERAWKLLLLRERLLLFAPLRHGQQKQKPRVEASEKARLVRGRVAALHQGDWAELLEEARSSGRGLRVARRNTPTEREERTLADEVLRKVLASEFSKAAQLLGSPGLAPFTADTAARLQELLRPQPARAAPPVTGHPSDEELLDEAVFRKVLKSSPRGSGAAVGGGRFEHWTVVLKSPSALAALLEVCQRVAQALLPASACPPIVLHRSCFPFLSH